MVEIRDGSPYLGLSLQMLFMIKTGTMEIDRLIIWIILLIVHVSVICLPFSIKKHSFKEQLIISPLLFVLFYATWNLIVVFLLIPFIIMWLICLSVYFNTRVAT